jgi:hypothetical protein
VWTKRQIRRLWLMSSWLCVLFGAASTVVAVHDYASLQNRPSPDAEAWMLAGFGVFSLVGGLYSLWRGPRGRF